MLTLHGIAQRHMLAVLPSRSPSTVRDTHRQPRNPSKRSYGSVLLPARIRIRPVSPDPAWSASPAADRSDHWRIRSA